MQGEGIVDACRGCTRAAHILRRIGFRDSITWGCYSDRPGATTVHGFHSNTEQAPRRVTTEKPTDDLGKGAGWWTPTTSEVLSPTPLCFTYRSELAWLTAGRPQRVMVYMAHPVAGDFERNVENAGRWLRWLRSLSTSGYAELTGFPYSMRPAIHAPWLAGIVPDDDVYGGREAALQECRDTVMLYDELWYVGGRVSSGMSYESAPAMVVRNLTHLGKVPPDGLDTPRERTVRNGKVTRKRS